jgi:class 3 adenylate cyclase
MSVSEQTGSESCTHEVSPPAQGTALLVDLRNFTPNLNAARPDGRGINTFCHFLSRFYALCLDACLVALPRSQRRRPLVYISSTGDGVLVVFTDTSHARHGYLAALILNNVLQTLARRYNAAAGHLRAPATSFGIGVESGEVCRVQAHRHGEGPPLVDTFIGACINVAARAEATTKLFYQATVIIAETTNELLCRDLFGTSYAAQVARAVDPAGSDGDRLAAQDELTRFNRNLCVQFIQHHNLKGVERPMPLYRVANASARPGNPRFDALIAKLTDGPEQLEDVVRFLNLHAPSSHDKEG